ncbi:MAG: hypothetical protein ACI8TX_003872, partial [Hyphomicrobiaceae bacterium]
TGVDYTADANPTAAGVAGGTEQTVIARISVVGVDARTRAIACVIRARVRVIGTCGCSWQIAGASNFVADVGAFAAARTGIAHMQTASTSGTGIGTIAKDSIITRIGVRNFRAAASAVAFAVGAIAAQTDAARAKRVEASVDVFLTGVAGRLVARVAGRTRTLTGHASFGAGAEQPIVAGRAIGRVYVASAVAELIASVIAGTDIPVEARRALANVLAIELAAGVRVEAFVSADATKTLGISIDEKAATGVTLLSTIHNRVTANRCAGHCWDRQT